MHELQGQVALITGGGGGLGEAICGTLAEAGVTVVPADVRLEPAERVAADVRADGGEATALRLDVSDEAQARAAVQTVLDRHGRLDILVNNAGIDVTLPVEDLTVGD